MSLGIVFGENAMTELNYADAPFAVRADLTAAHRATWDRISSPGTWLPAATRVAIAADWGRNSAEGRFLAAAHAGACRYFRVAI